MHTSISHPIWYIENWLHVCLGLTKMIFFAVDTFIYCQPHANYMSFMYTEFWIADYSVTFLLGITWRILIDHRLLKTFFSMAIEKWKIGVPSQQWVNSNWIMIYGSRCERKCVKLYKPNKGEFSFLCSAGNK